MNGKKGAYGIVYQNVLRSSELSPESKAIYGYLASFAGCDNTCFPSRKMMLKELQMSETRFSKHMNPLIALGVVSVTRERNGNVYGKNIYTINHKIQIIEKQDSRCSENESAENESAENLSTNSNSINNNSINNNSINIISMDQGEPDPTGSGYLLPLNDKSNYDVPIEKMSKWKQAYPAVDVEQELKKMIVWLDSNPNKKKTHRGIDRFINNWLERAQNRGGYFPYTESKNRQEVKNESSVTYIESYV